MAQLGYNKSVTISELRMTKQVSKKTSKQLGQIGRFGLVGVLNTLVDVIISNILILLFGLGVVAAGLISGTIAMINSYIFNQRFTFKTRKVSPVRTVYFFTITVFGLYIIRPLVLKLFVEQWLWPADFAYRITSVLHLPLSRKFDGDNLALAIAIIIVLGYNYIMYKKFVFVEEGA